MEETGGDGLHMTALTKRGSQAKGREGGQHGTIMQDSVGLLQCCGEPLKVWC